MIKQLKQMQIMTLAMRGTASTVVAIVLAMSACGCSKDRLPATGDCTFNSKLPLTVHVVVHLDQEDDGQEHNGRTPSEKPIVIPKCRFWFVQTAEPLDVPTLAREIASKGIPGLRLRSAADGDMAYLKDLTGLRTLGLWDTNITDVGLEHLSGLTGLRELSVESTKITDAGLVHLKGLTGLRLLNLGSTKITDAGLVHLKGLTELQMLVLGGTNITDVGLAHMKDLARLRWLCLSETKITDAGLAHLKDLTGLREIELRDTKVTDAGFASLRKALPGANIEK